MTRVGLSFSSYLVSLIVTCSWAEKIGEPRLPIICGGRGELTECSSGPPTCRFWDRISWCCLSKGSNPPRKNYFPLFFYIISYLGELSTRAFSPVSPMLNLAV